MLPLGKHGLIARVIWVTLVISALFALVVGRWPLAFVSLATLCLSVAPLILASRLRITLPVPFLAATTIFIFASIFMGEAFDFYERVWWWDLALHGASAVGFGLFGFLFVFMLFEGDRFAAPAGALAVISFCFAIMVGSMWEIFEFTMDQVFGLHMQKSGLVDTMFDLIVNAFGALIAAVSGYLYLVGRSYGFPGSLIEEFVRRNRRLYQKSKQRFRK
ncbi:MAG: hypothetical protein HKP40_00835 [Litoreibacter sp.]|nr:hypothetical protein [Litoreibacter sp.]